MAVHKVYVGPGEARLEWKRARQHVDRHGRPKTGYTPDEAKLVISRMTWERGSTKATMYPCPVCGWMHIGTFSQRGVRPTGMPDPVKLLEEGERVEAHERQENTGSQRRRIDAILRRGRSAEHY